jgi:Raf kinase inhibitor-like YbhB/YbcL family protein
MRITSPAFSEGGAIPVEFTIDGNGTFIPLDFDEVPDRAVTLALVIDDPDVPKERRPDGLFTHWTIWNLAPSLTGLRSEDAPGTCGATTLGTIDYVPPAPPVGDPVHRYFFTLHALDTTLDLAQGSTRDELLAAIEGHIIDQAQLMGRYSR